MRPKGAENQDLFRSLCINSEIGTSYVGSQGGVSGAKIHYTAPLLRFRRLQSHNWPKLRKWDSKLWNFRHKRFPKVRVFRTFGAHSDVTCQWRLLLVGTSSIGILRGYEQAKFKGCCNDCKIYYPLLLSSFW
jgi:hypothetical protein